MLHKLVSIQYKVLDVQFWEMISFSHCDLNLKTGTWQLAIFWRYPFPMTKIIPVCNIWIGENFWVTMGLVCYYSTNNFRFSITFLPLYLFWFKPNYEDKDESQIRFCYIKWLPEWNRDGDADGYSNCTKSEIKSPTLSTQIK